MSVAAHATIALALVALVKLASNTDVPAAPRPTTLEEGDDESIVIELPHVQASSPLLADQHEAISPPEPPRPSGGSDPRPDTGARGRGGESHVTERALNLADRDDGLSRDRSVLSRLDRSQLARIRAGGERRSREDWRASRDPMEVSFFVMGTTGIQQERRPASDSDPGAGARFAAPRDSLGAAERGAPFEPDGFGLMAQPLGGDHVGGPTQSAGLGVRSGARFAPESERAKLADGRPDVDRSTPSVFANDQGKASDTTDSEQEVAARTQSIVHSSTAGGKAGAGKGGQDGPGAPGSGGERGLGSVSSPLGSGGSGAPDPNESARIGYVRAVQSKIQPLWANAFPRKAIMEGLQGTATVRFVIDVNGNVTGAVVSRSSGNPEFDENVRQAVLKGAPYGRLPQALLPRLNMTIPFTAKNPIVRPKDPNEGIAER